MGSHRHVGKRWLELLMAKKLLQNSALTISPRLPLLMTFLRRALQNHPSARVVSIDTLSLDFVEQPLAFLGNQRRPDRSLSKEDFYKSGHG